MARSLAESFRYVRPPPRQIRITHCALCRQKFSVFVRPVKCESCQKSFCSHCCVEMMRGYRKSESSGLSKLPGWGRVCSQCAATQTLRADPESQSLIRPAHDHRTRSASAPLQNDQSRQDSPPPRGHHSHSNTKRQCREINQGGTDTDTELEINVRTQRATQHSHDSHHTIAEGGSTISPTQRVQKQPCWPWSQLLFGCQSRSSLSNLFAALLCCDQSSSLCSRYSCWICSDTGTSGSIIKNTQKKTLKQKPSEIEGDWNVPAMPGEGRHTLVPTLVQRDGTATVLAIRSATSPSSSLSAMQRTGLSVVDLAEPLSVFAIDSGTVACNLAVPKYGLSEYHSAPLNKGFALCDCPHFSSVVDEPQDKEQSQKDNHQRREHTPFEQSNNSVETSVEPTKISPRALSRVPCGSVTFDLGHPDIYRVRFDAPWFIDGSNGGSSSMYLNVTLFTRHSEDPDKSEQLSFGEPSSVGGGESIANGNPEPSILLRWLGSCTVTVSTVMSKNKCLLKLASGFTVQCTALGCHGSIRVSGSLAWKLPEYRFEDSSSMLRRMPIMSDDRLKLALQLALADQLDQSEQRRQSESHQSSNLEETALLGKPEEFHAQSKAIQSPNEPCFDKLSDMQASYQSAYLLGWHHSRHMMKGESHANSEKIRSSKEDRSAAGIVGTINTDALDDLMHSHLCCANQSSSVSSDYLSVGALRSVKDRVSEHLRTQVKSAHSSSVELPYPSHAWDAQTESSANLTQDSSEQCSDWTQSCTLPSAKPALSVI